MITVIDSIMGSGKTSFMIDYINTSHQEALGSCFGDEPLEAPKFIYVAPLLSEVDRISEACPGLQFRDPQPVQGRKLYHLSSLVEQGANICTTHALFKSLTKDICQKIKEQNYVLIIDEALECVSIFDELSPSDREILFRDNLIYVEEGTNRVRWNHKDNKKYSGKFNHIRDLCDNGNLVHFRSTVMLWEFPTDFIQSFSDVFVLTYLFSGSPMAAYLQAEGLEYDVRTIRAGELIAQTEADETEIKARLRRLIHIYEGSLNKCGESTNRANPFSATWLGYGSAERLKTLKAIKATTEYFFKSVAGTLATENAWTTFSGAKRYLSGERYTRGFIPCNAKATNEHRHKKSLAYLCNVFYNPYIKGYFEDRGIVVDEEAYALSEMIQWIWRSQIRDGKPITVFAPSDRMRGLLVEWLYGSEDSQCGEVRLAA